MIVEREKQTILNKNYKENKAEILEKIKQEKEKRQEDFESKKSTISDY